MPGAAVVVVHPDRATFEAAGVTNVEHPLPVTPDTLFQVGSISKTFTTTALLRLVERGRLDLDRPVREYLPEFRLADMEAAAQVTPRQLLTHSGGFYGDFFPDTGDGDDALARAVDELGGLAQLTPVGRVRSYSNSGFYVLGRLLEILSGQRFEDAMARLVLRPLGLRNTWYFPTDVMTRRFVAGHEWIWAENRNRVARPWAVTRATNPVGGVVSCARDLARYARFHLSDRPLVAAMRQPQPPHTGMVFAKGLAWVRREVGGAQIVEHGGATLGQQCLLTLVPERGFAVALLTNSSRGREAAGGFVRWALEAYLGLKDPDPAPLHPSPEQLEELAGDYHGQLADYRLSVSGAELLLATTPKGGFPYPDSPPPPTPPPLRLALQADDRLAVLDERLRGEVYDVLRDGGGEVEWIRIGGRICKRLYS